MKNHRKEKCRNRVAANCKHAPATVVPAGSRADKHGRGGIPIPSDESIREAFLWVQEHQQ